MVLADRVDGAVTGPVDIVCPVRPTRPLPDHLKWVIRSWDQHFDVARVILVGSLPDWAHPGKVEFVPTYQVYGKFWNIGINLLATLASDVSDSFVWLNDDFFLLHDLDTVPLTNKGPWDDVIDKLGDPTGTKEHQEYIAGFRSQRDILRAWGYDTSVEPCTDLHTPFPVHKNRMVDLLTKVRTEFPDHPVGHFRGLYGAGLQSAYMTDVKVKKNDRLPNPDWWTVSTSLTSWNGALGEYLRERFGRKSRWEK